MDFLTSLWSHPQVKLAVAGGIGAALIDLRKWAQQDMPWSWSAFGKHVLIGLLSGGGLGQIAG